MPNNSGNRKSGRRGARSQVLDERTLWQRIKACKTRNPKLILSSPDNVVEILRANHSEYSRIKLRPFTAVVSGILEEMSITDAAEEVDGSGGNRRRKKLKREEESEERLQTIERMHIDKRRGSGDEESESDEVSEESSDGDAVYEERVEPEFDLMKDLLRESLSRSRSNGVGTPNGVGKRLQEKVMEVELNSGEEKKRELFGEKGKVGTGSGSGSRLGGLEVKGKDGGVRFSDLGGMESVLEEIKREVIIPLLHPEVPLRLGVKPVAGILLHGPPGCGKTKLAHAIANETGVPFYKISATEVVSGVSGASEENIRELFSKAYRTAPSVVFIDEIDAIASKRENLQRQMEQRIVTQLMMCMGESDQLVQPSDVNSDSGASDQKPGYVLVIGATNRPDAIDPALRRPGRFDREIVLGVPDENARLQILSVLTLNLRLEGSFDLMKIARSTPGFVGADLAALANKAGNLAMKRIIDQRKSKLSSDLMEDETTSEEWWRQSWLPEEIEKLSINMADFEEAVKLVQPSSRREGFSAVPNVKWEDVGGLDNLRQEFDRYIVRRIKYPEDYTDFGVDLETGFLLYGPPGCGKTLIAKAVANEAGANFIHIKGPELLNKYVGESELAVRTLFSRARTCAPCILFFDEVDALTTKRGKEGGWVVERLLNQLLIELDGSEQRKGVFVIGATNRPEVMDRAVLRPGRFGKLLYVPLPSPDERGLILKAIARNKPIDNDVDLSAIGRMESCENLSGADLSALMNEAAMVALEEKLKLTESRPDATPCTIKATHFEHALSKVSPSVSDKQKQYYQVLSQSFKAA